jgi:putative membrane protein
MRAIIKWLVCLGAIVLAASIFPRYIDFSGAWGVVLLLATVLWLVNLLIRPVAQIASIVVTIMTLGLFSLVVNAAMVWLADLIVPQIAISSFWIYLFIAVIISVGNTVLLPKRRVVA